MPAFFPAPRPDELLYGLVARHGVMAGHGSGAATMRDVFGAGAGVVAVDLPRGLDKLVARLPPGHGIGADRLVDRHTLHPYLLRFATEALGRAVRAYMTGEAARRPARLGVMSGAFPTRERLLLCPACARRDDAECGLATWRRVHQLPAVVLCPEHDMPLRIAWAERVHRSGAAALTAATADVVQGAEALAGPRAARGTLAAVARDSLLLLDPGVELLRGASLQARLRELLHEFRWSRSPSLLEMSALVRAFRRSRTVRHVMEAAGASPTDGQLATALNRLVYREEVAKHPLLVLMVLDLVGASLRDLSVPEMPGFPGEKPGACTDTAPGMSTVDSEAESAAAPGRPMATSTGAGPGHGARGTPASPVVRDAAFDRAVAGMLDDGASLRAVARAVGLAPTTVMRHARRLGVWRGEWKDRPKVRLRAEELPWRLLKGHRAAWACFRSAHPEVPAKLMPKPAFNAYRYLMRHDREWLGRHHPLTRRVRRHVVDWDARDLELAERAVRLLSPLAGQDGGCGLSRGEVGRRMGVYGLVMRHMDRLPRLAAVLRDSGVPGVG